MYVSTMYMDDVSATRVRPSVRSRTKQPLSCVYSSVRIARTKLCFILSRSYLRNVSVNE